MKNQPFRDLWSGKPAFGKNRRGFALVITLSMMILLTGLAVGLLSLSIISLRASTRGDAARIARSNARLALSMAIAQLQKHAGPDTRITAPGNLADSGFPHGVTGVWRSWRPPESGGDHAAEQRDRFLGYLVSDPSNDSSPDPGNLPGNGSGQLLVGPGSLGKNPPAGHEVRAPLIATTGGAGHGALAWATLDEGVKGRIDLPPAEKARNSEGDRIARVGSSARNRADRVPGADFLHKPESELQELLPKLVSFGEAGFMASDHKMLGPFWHDFTVSSLSLQSDAANGGLKTDLSVLFDGARLPAGYRGRTRFLYSDTSTPLAASEPMWELYANYSKLYLNSPGTLTATVPERYAYRGVTDPALRATRYEPNMTTVTGPLLVPTVLRVDTIFSLVARDAHGPWIAKIPGNHRYMLHLQFLPVITLHNPYNVPLSFSQLEIQFEDIPIGFEFFVNGQSTVTNGQLTPLDQMFDRSGNRGKIAFKLSLTGDIDRVVDVVMGPGETRIFAKPFPPDWSWGQESTTNAGSASNKFFSWTNNKTAAGAKIMPGLITDARRGMVGYDIDWLIPHNHSPARQALSGTEGVLYLAENDTISVRYGPRIPTGGNNTFTVTTTLKSSRIDKEIGKTQVFYRDEARLKQVLEEGTSPRAPDKRAFPETYPKPRVDPAITTRSIHEPNDRLLKDYRNARAFTIFSFAAKTTRESFTLSRPVADTGIAMPMATCNLITAASQGTSPLEFTLAPVQNGAAAIESDEEIRGYFFGGHGASNGTSRAAFYEIPRAPLQSIAQFRHVNGASLGTVPFVTYSVGESRTHPAIAPGTAVDGDRLDHSWLANRSLWDKYWFSTLSTLGGHGYNAGASASQSELAAGFFDGSRQLPNPRNLPYRPAGVSSGEAADNAVNENGLKSAAHILTRGGFNVNSVSVPAWISVLSSLAGAEIPLSSSSGLEPSGDGIPVLRTRQAGMGLAGTSPRDRLWNSYRVLEPGQVEDLAKLIVEEIRERGPFLSMSDFVNRRLSGKEDHTLKGALQAAIDKSGFNRLMEDNALPVAPSDVAAYGWRNPAAVTGNTGAGALGEISQGDILSAIGSFVSVRSDTFVVRAYGDARDAQGNVLARAWCEATVQRFPEYIDPQDAPEAAPSGPANEKFGRRFEIVAFRWLNQDEV